MKIKLILPFFVMIIVLFISSCMWPEIELEKKETEKLSVHFIDVGQGDCIFAQMPGGKTMLIDAGSKGDGENIVDYITSIGVKKIDYVIGTHPHEDHIGGLANVILNFEIGEIYMPRAYANTRVFEDLLAEIDTRGYKISTAAAGESLFGYESVKAEFFAPKAESEYGDLNNYSAVIKLTFDDISFLFTGDAEDISEEEMLSGSKKMKTDVLKVGHHGSESSTCVEFLEAVSPEYAVISCGIDNKYGHPSEETLEKLESVQLYRTDLDGTIIFITDGKNISVETEGH